MKAVVAKLTVLLGLITLFLVVIPQRLRPVSGSTGSLSLLVGSERSVNSVSAATAQPASDVVPMTACTYTLDQTQACFPPGGEAGMINVTPNPSMGCPFEAISNASWIQITSGSPGDGPGTVQYFVQPNPGNNARQGTITVAGITYTVSERGNISCVLPITPTQYNFSASGGSGSGTVPLTKACDCAWTASTDFPDWITITSGGSPSTKSGFSFTIAPNTTGSPRSGTINVASQDITINQSSGCSYTIAPSSQSFNVAGGPGTFNMTTGNFCNWSVFSNVPWIAINSVGSGSGSTQVSYTVSENTSGLARAGFITIGNQSFAVSQDGLGCGYSIAPTFQEVDPSGALGLIDVSANSGCDWTAASNDSWITITSSATGAGDGAVTFQAAANTGGARTGTITVAGQTFTIDQAGPSDQADLSVSISADPEPVAAGTRLMYTTVVTNAGPTAATGVTLNQTIPDGATFASIESTGFVVAPGAGQTGSVTCSLESIAAGKTATVVLTVNVLGSPGSALTTTAQVNSLTTDPVQTNNSTTQTTQILGGGIVALSWSQPASTDSDPTPAPTGVTVGVASSSQTTSARPAKSVKPAASSSCTLTGYNVYISSSMPVQPTPANLWKTIPVTTNTTVPAGPAGSFYVVTSLWNCGGNIVESGPGVSSSGGDAGVPPGPMLTGVTVGNKIRATGTGFGSSVQVFIDGVTFAKASRLKKQSLLVQKGGLVDGTTINQAVSGKTVLITFQNPDGGIATYTYPPEN